MPKKELRVIVNGGNGGHGNLIISLGVDKDGARLDPSSFVNLMKNGSIYNEDGKMLAGPGNIVIDHARPFGDDDIALYDRFFNSFEREKGEYQFECPPDVSSSTSERLSTARIDKINENER